MAVAMALVLCSVAACGESVEAGAVNSKGRNPSANSTVQNPWTEADLNRVALTDRDGYEVAGRAPQSPDASDRTAEPAECSPIVQTLGQSSSAYPANARINRIFSAKGAGSGTVMNLASHSSGDAERVVQEFRTAAAKCTAFKDIGQSFDYKDVEVQPDPGYGDESVSLRMAQIVSYPDGESLKVPYAVVVARKGATVAMFYNFNMPLGANGKKSASIPDDLVKAQLKKIVALGAAG
ncbi:hypothetical protein J7E95_31255 [Streptomyces sp. ISL-14]|nr:hypothetical protein [Streptomyces sp. ISL-14]